MCKYKIENGKRRVREGGSSRAREDKSGESSTRDMTQKTTASVFVLCLLCGLRRFVSVSSLYQCLCLPVFLCLCLSLNLSLLVCPSLPLFICLSLFPYVCLRLFHVRVSSAHICMSLSASTSLFSIYTSLSASVALLSLYIVCMSSVIASALHSPPEAPDKCHVQFRRVLSELGAQLLHITPPVLWLAPLAGEKRPVLALSKLDKEYKRGEMSAQMTTTE